MGGDWPQGHVQQLFANPMPDLTLQGSWDRSDSEVVRQAPKYLQREVLR